MKRIIIPRPPEVLVRLAYLAICWVVLFGGLYYFYPTGSPSAERSKATFCEISDIIRCPAGR